MQLNCHSEKINQFQSVVEASKVTGINKSSIAKVLRGERKMAGGYFYNYKRYLRKFMKD